MRAPLLVALLILTQSCSNRESGTAGDGYQHQEASLYTYAVEGRPRLSTTVARSRAPSDSAMALHSLVVTSTTLVRTAEVSLEVDSLDGAIGAARAVAARFGGFIAGFDRRSAGSWRPSATLEVRVPVQHLDDAVAAIAALGHAESVQLTGEDVGEEFVDVTARLDNARRLERRYLDLLARGTGQLKDVLQVEEALARVREEIERIEGRRRYLQTTAQMSTLNVSLHEAGPAAGLRVSSTAGEAFGQAWRNFLTLTSTLIAASGVFVPLGVLAAGAWVALRRSRRRTSARVATL